MVTNDKLVKAGETTVIPFTFGGDASANTITFTIDLDPTQFDLLQVNPGKLAAEGILDFIGLDEESGSFATTWFSLSERQFDMNDILFELVIQAKRGATLSHGLQVSSKLAEAVSKGARGGENTLEVAYETKELQIGIELFQNAPNPFKDLTTIGFYLDESGQANLTIKDATGRSVIDRSGFYDKGYHQIAVQRKDLKTNGLLFYSLRAGDRQVTRKMMLMN